MSEANKRPYLRMWGRGRWAFSIDRSVSGDGWSIGGRKLPWLWLVGPQRAGMIGLRLLVGNYLLGFSVLTDSDEEIVERVERRRKEQP